MRSSISNIVSIYTIHKYTHTQNTWVRNFDGCCPADISSIYFIIYKYIHNTVNYQRIYSDVWYVYSRSRWVENGGTFSTKYAQRTTPIAAQVSCNKTKAISRKKVSVQTTLTLRVIRSAPHCSSRAFSILNESYIFQKID